MMVYITVMEEEYGEATIVGVFDDFAKAKEQVPNDYRCYEDWHNSMNVYYDPSINHDDTGKWYRIEAHYVR